MKRYLAFYGDNYYPNGGMDDFVGSYDTLDEAKSAVSEEHLKRTHPPHYSWDSMWAHIYDSVSDSEACMMHGGLSDWRHNTKG
jgi:hypothetical protein